MTVKGNDLSFHVMVADRILPSRKVWAFEMVAGKSLIIRMPQWSDQQDLNGLRRFLNLSSLPEAQWVSWSPMMSPWRASRISLFLAWDWKPENPAILIVPTVNCPSSYYAHWDPLVEGPKGSAAAELANAFDLFLVTILWVETGTGFPKAGVVAGSRSRTRFDGGWGTSS